jgi:type I restriction enzyme, S subunit
VTTGANASLPRNWTCAQLGQIGDVQLGKMLDRKRTEGTRLRYLRNINVRWGSIDTSDLLEMPFKETELDRFALHPGDVLVCEGGEPGRAAVWQADDPKIKYQKALHRVRMSGGIVPDWLVYHLHLDAQRGALTKHLTGTTIKHLPREAFQAYLLRIAPVPEQARIVSAIESYFTRLDDAVATLERVQRNLKRYRASVLKAAVEGRLVPTEAELARAEGRSYEPASVLIDRTEAPPRPNRWNSRSMDVVPGHAALAIGNPKTPLPEGWEWSPLVNIARMESGHTPSREHPEWWDGDVPWIGIADARAHHGGRILKTLQHTNADGLANSAARLLPAGTVCVSRTASVGYVVVTGRPMATSQDFVNWVPTEAVTSAWLRLVFCASREALIRFGKGSVHKTIYFPEWLSVHIAVPPALEQARIVAEADRLLSVADAAEATLAAGVGRCARLRQAILKWAFEGRLVDQDPTDEPASVLLDRIRAERASATDKPPRRARSARAAKKQGS